MFKCIQNNKKACTESPAFSLLKWLCHTFFLKPWDSKPFFCGQYKSHRWDSLLLEVRKRTLWSKMGFLKAFMFVLKFAAPNPIRVCSDTAGKLGNQLSPRIRWAALYQIHINLPGNKTKAHQVLPRALYLWTSRCQTCVSGLGALFLKLTWEQEMGKVIWNLHFLLSTNK